MTETIKLKPCPFCGGEAHIEVDDVQEPEQFWTYSPKCEHMYCMCYALFEHCSTEEEAAEIWNTRSEYTCTLVKKEYGDPFSGVYYAYTCSECGYQVRRVSEFVEAHIPNYCEGCGAKIIIN